MFFRWLCLSFLLHALLLGLPLLLARSGTPSAVPRFAPPGSTGSRRFELSFRRAPASAVAAVSAAHPAASDEGSTRPAARFASDVIAAENQAIQNGILYPPLARKMDWEGEVTVDATVDTSGRPTDVRVARSSGFAVLDEAALRGVRAHRFPAPGEGAPVRLVFIFRLRDGGL